MVSEQALVRAGLRQLIESPSGLKVVGEASGRSDALMLAARVRPDIVLIDIDTQNGNGIHLLRDLFIPAQEARLMILASARNMEAYQMADRTGRAFTRRLMTRMSQATSPSPSPPPIRR
jgi:DNA-binding NarL/FixJ family response regulator